MTMNRVSITASNGIGPLVSLLGSSNFRARKHAEGALVRLSIESENRAIIIKKLVGMLVDKGTSAQEQAAAALANLASDSAENRNSIVDAGGIAPLLTLLEGTSSKAKEQAVSAISKLAYKSAAIQSAISQAGGIPLLANVLTSSSNNVENDAVRAAMFVSRECRIAACRRQQRKPDCYRRSRSHTTRRNAAHPRRNFKRRRLVLSRGFRSITPRTAAVVAGAIAPLLPSFEKAST